MLNLFFHHQYVKKEEQNKVQELLESNYSSYQVRQNDLVKLSVIGYGITQDNQVLNEIIKVFKQNQINVLKINLTQAKIEILIRQLEDEMVAQLHQKLIENR